MATPAVLRVRGADQLRRGLRAAGDDLTDGRTVHKQIAAVVVAAARPPRGRSGRTASSVRPGATQRAAIVRAGRASIPYVGPDHYGWPQRNIRENPWLIAAAQSSETTWFPLYERYVERSLNKIQGAT